jgi:hypothetical protein
MGTMNLSKKTEKSSSSPSQRLRCLIPSKSHGNEVVVSQGRGVITVAPKKSKIVHSRAGHASAKTTTAIKIRQQTPFFFTTITTAIKIRHHTSSSPPNLQISNITPISKSEHHVPTQRCLFFGGAVSSLHLSAIVGTGHHIHDRSGRP